MTDIEKIIMSMQAEQKCIKARLLILEQREMHREENK